MTYNPHTHKRINLTISTEQLHHTRQIMRLARCGRMDLIRQWVVMVTGPADERAMIGELWASVRAPYASGRYWSPYLAFGAVRGDERLVGERKIWSVDFDLTGYAVAYASTEGMLSGVRLAKNPFTGEEMNPFVDVSRDHAHGPVIIRNPPRAKETGKYLDRENSFVPEDNKGRRERGWGIASSQKSHKLMPWAQSVLRFAFSTEGKIPAMRAISLAAWCERFIWHAYPESVSIRPQTFDEKWEILNQRFDKLGDQLLHPHECLQESLDYVSLNHPIWTRF